MSENKNEGKKKFVDRLSAIDYIAYALIVIAIVLSLLK